MQFDLAKSIKKVFSAFSSLEKLPKTIIRHGANAFLLLLALGTVLVIFNRTSIGSNYYSDFIANSLVKTSFVILAEAVIGGLVMDFAFKKSSN